MKLDHKIKVDNRPDRRRRYEHVSPPPLPLGTSRSPSPSHLEVRYGVPLRRRPQLMLQPLNIYAAPQYSVQNIPAINGHINYGSSQLNVDARRSRREVGGIFALQNFQPNEFHRRHNSNHHVAPCNRSRLPSARADQTPGVNNQFNPNTHCGPNIALPHLVSNDNAHTSPPLNAELVSTVPPSQADHRMYNYFDEPCNSNVHQSRPGHRPTECLPSENFRQNNRKRFVLCSNSALSSDNTRSRSPSTDSISDLSS
ncbi:uncharacterized protein LOC119679513 [Teleopsis dalmanni]|uniref:uncharacterized protein LOC119679513 n=1 Tax=Teleopsis dalmanni TaxID=139649 RepID=UPI000D32A209|nr:uncharacterized protein LOC119679513 [Teleopsis dalmanni]